MSGLMKAGLAGAAAVFLSNNSTVKGFLGTNATVQQFAPYAIGAGVAILIYKFV